ncbi:MAG: AAA family ATPase [Verrucomicrobiae bacterium]|nr:AAA family ATPase [Verrucomicrobiae bacterium]
MNGVRKTEYFPELTGIEIGGYKSLAKKQFAELRGLTVLAGANSSGKSSLMQPLLLLKQTLEVSYDPGPLLLEGPNVRFSEVDQLFSRLPGGKGARTVEIALQFQGRIEMRLEFERGATGGITITKAEYIWDGHRIALRPGMTNQELQNQYVELLKPVYGGLPEELKEYQIFRERFFLNLAVQIKGRSGFAFPVHPLPSVFVADRMLRGLVHLPGLRGNPSRTYPATGVSKVFPGTFENYTAAVIAHWERSGERDKLEALNADLETLGLTWKVTAKPVTDTQVELLVGRLPRPARGGARDLVNIADVGFGVSQALPVVVALHAAEKGQVVYLEQPEIHLHPKAQVALAQVLARAVKRGIQVVVETHSHLLLLAIQTLVAEGKQLSPNQVKLHWFVREPGDGTTTIKSADLDENGTFGDWPEDFAKTVMELESRFLDAAQMRLPTL